MVRIRPGPVFANKKISVFLDLLRSVSFCRLSSRSTDSFLWLKILNTCSNAPLVGVFELLDFKADFFFNLKFFAPSNLHFRNSTDIA